MANQFARVSVGLVGSRSYNLQFTSPDATFIETSAFFRITGTIDPGTTPPPPPPPPPSGNEVPEPSTYALTGMAFALLRWFQHRRR